jgi:mannose-1-phosphate guanylyltransferase
MIQAVARAMVLGAGYGTRLRPLTDELPKPLLPFGDRSLLEHALTAIRDAGLGPEVVVNTHHLAEEFERRLESFSLGVRLLREPVLRGTAGGIAGARAWLEPGTIVILTADVVLERVPPGFRESAGKDDMVMAIAARPRGAGPVGVSAEGTVVRLRGRTFGVEAEGGEYVGLLALGERCVRELPELGCYIQDYAIPRLERGGVVRAFGYDGRFSLPGDDLAGYLDRNLLWLEQRGAETAYLGENASVARGVRLSQTVIGAGARVEGEGSLTRTVVFPGARAQAPLSSAIVTPKLGAIKI